MHLEILEGRSEGDEASKMLGSSSLCGRFADVSYLSSFSGWLSYVGRFSYFRCFIFGRWLSSKYPAIRAFCSYPCFCEND